MKYVVVSTAKAELIALYVPARELEPLHNTLEERGWHQLQPPIQSNNSTAAGFANDTIVQHHIKLIWMHLHWLHYYAAHGHFCFYCNLETTNLADYCTKHHPPPTIYPPISPYWSAHLPCAYRGV